MKYTLGLKGLPFEPHPKQIIYVENEYDEEINHFIFDHHEDLCNYFKLFGYEFCYLPLLSENFDKWDKFCPACPIMDKYQNWCSIIAHNYYLYAMKGGACIILDNLACPRSTSY